MIKLMKVGILIILLMTSFKVNVGVPTPTKVVKQEQTIKPSRSKAFQAAVNKRIHKLKIEHPEIVYIQFREESGNGGSALSVKHYNLFGMKYPTKRKTTAVGKTKSGYAIYKSWKDSVEDYKIFQKFYMSGLSRSQYLSKLRRSYATNPNYLKNFLK